MHRILTATITEISYYYVKKGISDVEIAKQLGLGLGEVRLVIGLFEGEIKNEA